MPREKRKSDIKAPKYNIHNSRLYYLLNIKQKRLSHTIEKFNLNTRDSLMKSNYIVINSRNNLHKVIKHKKNTLKICEVGVFMGDYSKILNKTFAPLELWLIDPWIGSIKSGDANGQNHKTLDGDFMYAKVCKDFINSSNVHILRHNSEILSIFPNNYFDLIYIDGDHSYNFVKHDLLLSFYKVKSYGWILAHDYDANLKKYKPDKWFHQYADDVKRAVNEFCLNKSIDINLIAMDGVISVGIINKKTE